jgi:hypothetical protein
LRRKDDAAGVAERPVLFVVRGLSRDAGLRRVAEDAFVGQLALRGVRAVPSYAIFPQDPETLTAAQ